MSDNESKLVSLQQAIATVPGEASIAVGGTAQRNRPMASLRALIRAGKAPRRVWLAGRDACADLLSAVWPGCVVDAFDTPGDGTGAGSAQAFLGLTAAACGATSFTVPASDNDGGFDGVRIDAIAPDVALLHVPFADERGNAVWPLDDMWLSHVLACASDAVILIADEMLSPAQMATQRSAAGLDPSVVDLVVHVPFGAHPTACERLYEPDELALAELQAALSRPDRLASWCERLIYGPTDHIDYLEATTSAPRLVEISLPAGLSWPIKR